MVRKALALVFMVALGLHSKTRAADRLPIEDFCRAPTLTGAKLSPDGNHLGAMTSEKGEHYILLSDLRSGKIARFRVPRLRHFQWATQERLLCFASGDRFGEVFAVDQDGTQVQELLAPYYNQMVASQGYRVHWMSVLRAVPRWKDSILVEEGYVTQLNQGQWPHPNACRLNLFTGQLTLEEKNPGRVLQWLADRDGNVRGAIALDKDTVQLLYRRSKQDSWTVVHRSIRSEADLLPVAFGASEQLYVMAHNGQDTTGLYSFDPNEGTLTRCWWQDQQFDLARTVFSPAGGLLGVMYEADRMQFKPLDEGWGKMQAQIEAVLPGNVNLPLGMTPDGKKMLEISYSDRQPGTYYLVDTAKGEFGVVGRAASWIKPEQMAAMKPIEYTAHDGLQLHGYLTLPTGTASTNLPLIVMPHGGPAARDSWQYNPTVQFLANRGYAVLQVNFRGSIGYGLQFSRAGFKEWGGKMQEDISDGVRWAVTKGIADSQRVGIYGGSYGGYAALMGLVTTPELYKCAVCYAGVTDVREFVRRTSLRGELRAEFEHVVRERIGDYREDKQHLEEISPVHLAERVQAPLLLAFGEKDPIVDIEQGHALAKALKKNKKKFELIVEKEEGHGFRSERALSNFFFHVEAFLKTNLGERKNQSDN